METYQGIELSPLTKKLLTKYCKENKEKPEDVMQRALEHLLEKQEPEQNERYQQKLAKVMGGNLITFHIELFSRYVEFARQYMEFFNIKDSFEIFCMRLIYDELERLHRELTEFVEDGKHFVDAAEWYNKNPHIACTSHQIPDDEE